MPSTENQRTENGTAWPASTALGSQPSPGMEDGPCSRQSKRCDLKVSCFYVYFALSPGSISLFRCKSLPPQLLLPSSLTTAITLLLNVNSGQAEIPVGCPHSELSKGLLKGAGWLTQWLHQLMSHHDASPSSRGQRAVQCVLQFHALLTLYEPKRSTESSNRPREGQASDRFIFETSACTLQSKLWLLEMFVNAMSAFQMLRYSQCEKVNSNTSHIYCRRSFLGNLNMFCSIVQNNRCLKCFNCLGSVKNGTPNSQKAIQSSKYSHYNILSLSSM